MGTAIHSQIQQQLGLMATGMHHHPQVLNGIPHVAALLTATVPL